MSDQFTRIPLKMTFTILLQVHVKRLMDKTCYLSFSFLTNNGLSFSVCFPKEGHITGHSKAERTVHPAESLRYSTTQFVTVSLCCVSLQQKAKEKRNHYSVIEQNALRDNYMENMINVPGLKV